MRDTEMHAWYAVKYSYRYVLFCSLLITSQFFSPKFAADISELERKREKSMVESMYPFIRYWHITAELYK